MLAVSPYNQLALKGFSPPESVSMFDTTLRDGEQAPGIALSPEDKIRIAQALDVLGVDCMEVGFAASGSTEADTIRRICDLGLDAKMYSLARSVKSDIDVVADSGCQCVHTFIATSDLHLKYKLKMTREQVKARAVDAAGVERVKEAIRMLPPREKDALMMRYFQQLSDLEIADALDIAPVSARALISRARKRLRNLLEEGRG